MHASPTILPLASLRCALLGGHKVAPGRGLNGAYCGGEKMNWNLGDAFETMPAGNQSWLGSKFGIIGRDAVARDAVHEKPDAWSAAGLLGAGFDYVSQVLNSLMLAARRWQADDAASMAAAVAYYLSLSLFPMLLLLTSGVGLVLRFTRLGQDAKLQILAIVAEHCSPTLKAQVEQVLLQLGEQSLVGGPFGVLTAILAAIGVFYQLERAFDKIWRVPPTPQRGALQALRHMMTQRMVAFLLLAGVGMSIVLILVANVALGVVRQWMSYLHAPGIVFITLLDATATMSMNALAFGVLYRWLPKRPVLWRDAIRGGLLAAIIWEVGRQVLGAFFIGMRYATAYGAIGSFIALLLWFYWGITILFFGAEYVQVLSRRHAQPLKKLHLFKRTRRPHHSQAGQLNRQPFTLRVMKNPGKMLKCATSKLPRVATVARRWGCFLSTRSYRRQTVGVFPFHA